MTDGLVILVCLVTVILAGDGGLVLLHKWSERTAAGRAEVLPRAVDNRARFRSGHWSVGAAAAGGRTHRPLSAPPVGLRRERGPAGGSRRAPSHG